MAEKKPELIVQPKKDNFDVNPKHTAPKGPSIFPDIGPGKESGWDSGVGSPDNTRKPFKKLT